MDQRKDLRTSLCDRRASLPTLLQESAANNLLAHLQHWFNHDIPESVGAYLAVRGEIDLGPVLQWLEPLTTIYLPVISPSKDETPMRFAPWSSKTQLRKGQYNIDVPDVPDTALVTGMSLDTVLVPLVAFDRSGNRMGMGGGYYDRTFSRCLLTDADKPLLIGVAHDFQRVNEVPVEHWDVPMNIIITDKNTYLKG